MKYKHFLIYISVMIISLVGAYLLSGYTFEVPFPRFSVTFNFDLATVLGSLIACILIRKESFEDRIISLPLAVFAFSTGNLIPFVIFSAAFFTTLKIDNFKLLAYAFSNLLALLIFKNHVDISNVIFVVSGILIIGFTRNITLLSLFLLKYFILLDVNSAINEVHSLIIPFCILFLLVLYIFNKLRNALNAYALILLVLSPSVTTPVLFTAYSIIGISIIFDQYRGRSEMLITSNISMLTIVLSMTFLSGLAHITALVILLALFVEYNRLKVSFREVSSNAS